jgi:FkbM family methyltransferase
MPIKRKSLGVLWRTVSNKYLRQRGVAAVVLPVRLKRAARHVSLVLLFVWRHPANERRQLQAMFRLARFQVRGRLFHRRSLARLGTRSSVWASVDRWEASKVAYANPPDHSEMLVWRHVLNPSDLFIDVGANIGSYSIWAAELGAEVIAFEPADDTFGLLTENVTLNGYRIETLQAAAGARCGTASFTVGRDSANRLDPEGGAEIAMVTIDSIIGDRVVAGMKIDVEGFEIEVLRGCERALSGQRIKLIQLEWNSTSVTAVHASRVPVARLLRKHGYSLFRPDRDGVLIPLADTGFGADVFAMPCQVVGDSQSVTSFHSAGSDRR